MSSPLFPLRALLLLACLTAHAAACQPRPAALPPLQSGDLVFQTSRSRQSAAIQAATHSPLSHVGLVEVTAQGTFVLEAVQPVQRTPFERWRARGEGGRLLVLRHPGLAPQAREAVLREARRHLGKPYDARFGWGDEALYCSELVHKAYARGAGLTLGQRERLERLDLRALGPALRERYGGTVPLGLELVTPASLAADPALQRVYSDYAP
ncbi:peptidase [Aggregicoccus sp. 17bor-14]|uniref:YiiX/YebB-like N1pC/P60 family cysteine hydrolase n=1 Tax=Myxococcaceae TaxID=31 RepID=UPI00129C5E20|nr:MULTISPECIES: YiiX/YebB-like N1pC/P60 family cysteine hydrolase [Myxococcaceae]MBF5041778.1 peptidase [Simulacricoccus sp. 17bor-14]MRI87559.1 peptidase [Aggregicoccus sp. 17bor-14]